MQATMSIPNAVCRKQITAAITGAWSESKHYREVLVHNVALAEACVFGFPLLEWDGKVGV